MAEASITKTKKIVCCSNKCLSSGTCVARADIILIRQRFWKLDEKSQRSYILNFFYTNISTSKGKKEYIFLIEGKKVCTNAWLRCHGISKWR
jgi:hypothetical protein